MEIALGKMVWRISFAIAPLDLLVKDVRARLVSLSKMYLYHCGVNYHLAPRLALKVKINKIGRPRNRSPLLLFTSMITEKGSRTRIPFIKRSKPLKKNFWFVQIIIDPVLTWFIKNFQIVVDVSAFWFGTLHKPWNLIDCWDLVKFSLGEKDVI